MTALPKTITVIGTGYVGLTTAALLASSGFKVFALDTNQERLDSIKQGKSFFYEDGLDPIIEAGIQSGQLIPTSSYEESIPISDLIFSCVGTPDNPDGSSNLSYIFSAAETAGKLMRSGSIYVQKSTVPVGTGSKIEQLFSRLGISVDYVSNPEFLRESTAVYDTLYFDRVVAGGNNGHSVDAVINVYQRLEEHRDKITQIANIKTTPRKNLYMRTSLNSAELIKVTSNAFLALKISFANSIAKLADKANADIGEVMDAVGADERIGRAFLNSGRGYGGGCFPKDVSGLIASGLDYGVDLDIMQAAQALNQSMPGYIIEKLQSKLGGSLKGKQAAVLGLAFKAGTSDVRKSPGVALANKLKLEGALVRTYDPQAKEEAAVDLLDNIEQFNSIENAVRDVDVVVLATEWEEIITYPVESLKKFMRGNVMVDATNQYPKKNALEAGLVYIGVGH